MSAGRGILSVLLDRPHNSNFENRQLQSQSQIYTTFSRFYSRLPILSMSVSRGHLQLRHCYRLAMRLGCSSSALSVISSGADHLYSYSSSSQQRWYVLCLMGDICGLRLTRFKTNIVACIMPHSKLQRIRRHFVHMRYVNGHTATHAASCRGPCPGP